MTPDRPDMSLLPHWSDRANRLVWLVLLGLTLARTMAVLVSPLGLGVDEAQYWLWSETPAFGYFTKPPLTAWIIGAAHWLFGHHEAAVRLPASWLHLATAVLLWRCGDWLYGAAAGRVTALVWISLPATALGSFLISTDTPLMLTIALALLALAAAASQRLAARQAMLLAGIALGCGLLAKYAAAYALFGVMLIWAAGRHQTKPLVTGKGLLLVIAACLLTASPNLIWNLTHDFATVRHLGDNANVTRQAGGIVAALKFLAAQAAVAGPVLFVLMLGVVPASRTDHTAGWLAWMAMPALIFMTIQAGISEANANWAMAAYPPLAIWLGGFLTATTAWWRHRLGQLGIGINMLASTVMILISAVGSLGPLTPQSDPLRRLRGWDQLARDLTPELAAHATDRIIADRRAPAALLHWHFYNQPVTVMLFDQDGIPRNHFEANHSWTPRPNARVLALSAQPTPPPIGGINWHSNPVKSDVKISHNRQRLYYIHRGIEPAATPD